ncbi:MAG: transcriptional regulator, TetR family [Bryobacterales bacterium]|nr:transcriptional regulator, TetR family [Bryobacterales bacterium]
MDIREVYAFLVASLAERADVELTTGPKSEETIKRPGRPRDECARQRILDAALELLDRLGLAAVTVDAIAARAGVGKATVYRWWPNKAAVVIEAFREAVVPELPFPDTGSIENDIRTQMREFNRMLMGPRGRSLAAIVAAAQTDTDVAAALWNNWLGPRREEAREALLRKKQWPAGANPELLLDLLYAPMYYRLMLKHLPLSPEYAEAIADLALKAIG